MLISSLLHFRDRNPVCGRRIIPGASVIWFAEAPCSVAGAERGNEPISTRSWGIGAAEQESHAHTLPSSEQGPWWGITGHGQRHCCSFAPSCQSNISVPRDGSTQTQEILQQPFSEASYQAWGGEQCSLSSDTRQLSFAGSSGPVAAGFACGVMLCGLLWLQGSMGLIPHAFHAWHLWQDLLAAFKPHRTRSNRLVLVFISISAIL